MKDVRDEERRKKIAVKEEKAIGSPLILCAAQILATKAHVLRTQSRYLFIQIKAQG